ncbi:MAG TPA: hypothetical protein VNA69_11890 [Thermoanaerobaculia bacterium]|nr:hypothetical protein [Thermoanaerobaculia bacterium]
MARAYTEEEWEHFRQTFRGIKRRALPSTEHVAPDDQLGPIVRAFISPDPPGAADRLPRTTETCPVCGVIASPADRIAASVEPEYGIGFPVMIGAWAHPSCLASCIETPDDRGVPW